MIDPATVNPITDEPWREFQDAVGEADRLLLACAAQVAAVRAAGERYKAAFHADREDGASR